MAGVTQTIDTYYAGISQQSDLKKFPGQVKDIINAIPDVTDGLYKRPGAKRIGTTPLSSVVSNGSWFHYYRDETEGSYIGHIASNGKVEYGVVMMVLKKMYGMQQITLHIMLVLQLIHLLLDI